ncbi:HAD family hydrolase [Candidatus Gracilibacteria bacterium]|nr:MAG: HAD family hydrolase [Candidatus Gracilibacteria bacterium]
MKKYLIFDLDGTLIKSQKVLLELVSNYLKENFGIENEKSKYFLSSTRGMPLFEQIKEILGFDEHKAKEIANDIYKKIENTEKGNFFLGVPAKIKELRKNYKLFLSTGNSTTFAEENLKKGDIFDCFDYILGSENIGKSIEHIEIFKDYTGDKDFEKLAVFIGDGEKDRDIAKEVNMDFIHIDEDLKNSFGDQYEIKSVSEISDILSLINQNA